MNRAVLGQVQRAVDVIEPWLLCKAHFHECEVVFESNGVGAQGRWGGHGLFSEGLFYWRVMYTEYQNGSNLPPSSVGHVLGHGLFSLQLIVLLSQRP